MQVSVTAPGVRIDSRDDFFRVLGEAQVSIRRLLGYIPDEPTLQSLAGQLEVMRRWTAGGRTPCWWSCSASTGPAR